MRYRRPGAALGCAFLAAVWASALGSGTAHALSCEGNVVRAPGEGQVGVPTNTLIWGWQRSVDVRLVDARGAEVPLTMGEVAVGLSVPTAVPMPSFIQIVWMPGEELAPNSRYWIERHYESEVERTEFTTGDGPALSPPPLPVVESTRVQASRSWWGGYGSFFEYGVGHEGILIGTPAGFSANVEHVSELFDGATETIGWVTDTSTLAMGRGDCVYWYSGGDVAEIQLGVFDLAGNFSGWLDVPSATLLSAAEAEQIVLADEEAEAETLAVQRARLRHGGGHNCSMTPGAQPGGVAWGSWALSLGLCLGGYAFRRKRRSKRLG